MFSMDYIKGKMPLARAFWLYGVLVPVLSSMLGALLYAILIKLGVGIDYVGKLIYVFLTLDAFICIFGLIAVWQCANNTSRKLWTWLAVLFIPFATACMIEKWNVTQTFSAMIIGVWILLSALIAVWLLRGLSENSMLKRRVVPLLIFGLVSMQLVEHFYLMQQPMIVLVASNGNIKLTYIYDYQSRLKKMDEEALRQAPSYEKRAEQGDAEAAYELGSLYMDEKFSGANPEEAVRWLKFAIDHGITLAKNDLGLMYLEGRGVDKDKKAAFKLFEEGMSAGDDIATYNLGLMYETGEGTPVNYTEAAKYYARVVERTSNNPDGGCAENDLAKLYLSGKGVKQDEVEARSLFAEAARKEMAVQLPKGSKELHLGNDMDFPSKYAAYQLATLKHEPIDKSNFTTDEMTALSAVANYYEKRCRG